MRKVFSVFLALSAIFLYLRLPVLGEKALDINAEGSITVTLQTDGEPAPGGTLELYQVAGIHQENGDFRFEFTQSFRDCGLALDDLQSPDLAKKLLEYVEISWKNGVSVEYRQETAGEKGKVVFEDLPVGLYLLAQKEALPGYQTISPFLVTIPVMTEGEYCYDVDAYPKGGDTETPPTEPTSPSTEPGTNLPQTGQLKWPIPVLICLGLALLAVGKILSAGRKKDREA